MQCTYTMIWTISNRLVLYVAFDRIMHSIYIISKNIMKINSVRIQLFVFRWEMYGYLALNAL